MGDEGEQEVDEDETAFTAIAVKLSVFPMYTAALWATAAAQTQSALPQKGCC